MLGKIRKFLESHERVDLALFLVAGLVVIVWIRHGYFVYVWDTTYPVNAAAYLADFANVWISIHSTGFSDANGLPFLPYFCIVYFLQNLIGLPIVVAEAILFYLLFVMSGISMYKFAHELLHGTLGGRELRMVSIISGMFYTMNLYTLYYIWRIFTVDAFLLAFFPFVAYEIWKGLAKARASAQVDILGIIRIVLLSFLILPAFTNPAFLLTGGAFLGMLVLYGFWQKPRSRRSIFHQGIFAVMALSFWALTNLWWIFPQVTNSGVVLARVGTDWVDLQSNSVHSTLQNVVRLQGMPPLYQQTPATFVYSFNSLYENAPLFVAISFLIPIVGFASVTKASPVGRRALFIAIVSVAFMFAAEGLNLPFGPIFGWFYNHFSFMVAFRDPYSKIGWMIPFTYSILFPLGVLRIYKHVKKFPIRKHATMTRLVHLLIPAVLVFLIIGIYCWPFFTGDIILPGASVAIPSYYDSANSFLDSKPGTFRLLSLPLDQVLQGSVWDHGYVGNDLLRATSGREVISTIIPDQNVTSLLNNVMTLLQQNNTHVANILGLLNVRYVIIRNDADLNYSLAATSPSTLSSEIANQVGISHSATFGKLDLYENSNFSPRIYAVTNLTSPGSLGNPKVVGWTLQDYAGAWHASNSNATLTSSATGLSFSFTPNTSNSYAYFNNVNPLNVSVGTFPDLLLTFSTSNQAMLSVNVVSQTGASAFIYAVNPPAVSHGTAYSSPQSYTLLFSLENYFKPTDTVSKIYVNVTPASPGQSQMLGADISDMRLANFVGTNLDNVRLMASSSFNWTNTAIGTTSSNPLSGSPPIVGFRELRPSEYQVSVTDAASPFLLVFEETFDNNWQVFLGSSHHGVPIIANHLRVDGYANGWIIDIPGTYTLTIFYVLQNYAEFGFNISVGALFSLFLIAVIMGLKGRSLNPWLKKFAPIINSWRALRRERVSPPTMVLLELEEVLVSGRQLQRILASLNDLS